MRRVGNWIRQSFHVSPGAKEIADQVFALIDEVHGVSGVASLRITSGSLYDGWTGQFDPYSRKITLAPEALYPLSAAIHEIGHALDAAFLNSASGFGTLSRPDVRYASQHASGYDRGVLRDWFKVAISSRPITEFFAASRAVRFGTDAFELATYFFDPAEVWARSYEQFIAQNCRGASLKAEFHRKRYKVQEIGDRRIRVYWTYEEFATMEREMNRVFRELEWM